MKPETPFGSAETDAPTDSYGAQQASRFFPSAERTGAWDTASCVDDLLPSVETHRNGRDVRVEHHGRKSQEGQRFTDAFHSIQQNDPLTSADHPQSTASGAIGRALPRGTGFGEDRGLRCTSRELDGGDPVVEGPGALASGGIWFTPLVADKLGERRGTSTLFDS